jgi:hypothetical protein
LTAELKSFPGIKQYPLEKGRVSYGTINAATDGSELSIVPEHECLRDCGAVGSLIFRALEPMKAKHGYQYHIQVDQTGVLKWILLKAGLEPITEKEIKELVGFARWSFEHASKKAGTPIPSPQRAPHFRSGLVGY